jgi:hypothetical protein
VIVLKIQWGSEYIEPNDREEKQVGLCWGKAHLKRYNIELDGKRGF